ncbi:MAG: DUF2269 family protein [Acidimicrobiales bacterium]|nr:DUF2269 family protein [Acidimicrobiales bacterium]
MAADGAGFDVVLGLHVASGLVAMASVAATGAYAGMVASAARGRQVDARRAQAQRRFFRPGPNWPARMIFLVPAFGVLLLAMDGGFSSVREAWLLASIGCWLVAAVVALLNLWPAEAHVQRLLNEMTADLRHPELTRAARQVSWSAAIVDVVMVAAFVLMVVKPGA